MEVGLKSNFDQNENQGWIWNLGPKKWNLSLKWNLGLN